MKDEVVVEEEEERKETKSFLMQQQQQLQQEEEEDDDEEEEEEKQETTTSSLPIPQQQLEEVGSSSLSSSISSATPTSSFTFTTLFKYSFYLLLLCILLQQIAWYSFYQLFNTPMDPIVGLIRPQPHRPLLLQHFYKSKRILVVGGTRGIGRGVSMALASQGASVTIVGSTKTTGEATVSMLREQHRVHSSQSFEYVYGDLETNIGVLRLALNLHLAHGEFDAVVMTSSRYPNVKRPTNINGHDRTIFISVMARFLLIRRMSDTRLLTTGARIISIYASTKNDLEAPVDHIMKKILMKNKLFDGSIKSFQEILGTASLAHDILIATTAAKYKVRHCHLFLYIYSLGLYREAVLVVLHQIFYVNLTYITFFMDSLFFFFFFTKNARV